MQVLGFLVLNLAMVMQDICQFRILSSVASPPSLAPSAMEAHKGLGASDGGETTVFSCFPLPKEWIEKSRRWERCGGHRYAYASPCVNISCGQFRDITAISYWITYHKNYTKLQYSLCHIKFKSPNYNYTTTKSKKVWLTNRVTWNLKRIFQAYNFAQKYIQLPYDSEPIW